MDDKWGYPYDLGNHHVFVGYHPLTKAHRSTNCQGSPALGRHSQSTYQQLSPAFHVKLEYPLGQTARENMEKKHR